MIWTLDRSLFKILREFTIIYLLQSLEVRFFNVTVFVKVNSHRDIKLHHISLSHRDQPSHLSQLISDPHSSLNQSKVRVSMDISLILPFVTVSSANISIFLYSLLRWLQLLNRENILKLNLAGDTFDPYTTPILDVPIFSF